MTQVQDEGKVEGNRGDLCPYFGRCGGCQLMQLKYEEQLEFKRQRVIKALEHFGNFKDPDVSACVASPNELHYRNKVLLPVKEENGELVLGLYARDSHQLVQIEACLVHCTLGEQVFQTISQLLRTSKISAYDHSTGKGLLRFVQIRAAESTSAVLVTLVVKEGNKEKLMPLAESIMQNCPQVKGVVVNINTKPGNTAMGDTYQTLVGEGVIEEKVLDKYFKVSPASFFQVNLKKAEQIYQEAIALAAFDGSETLLDAYCGVGTLSLCASSYVKRVMGVEYVPEAIEDARWNAARNGVSNADFFCAKSEDFIASCEKVDIAFVNPPRKGCEKSFLQALVKLRPRKIIYISCDPSTLARDARILVDAGYRLGTIYPHDMFPQTSHVESVVKLELV